MSDQSRPQGKPLASEGQAQVLEKAPQSKEPEDHERGYVLRGYKKVSDHDHNFYLTSDGAAYEFRGGVSQGRDKNGKLTDAAVVPYGVYKEWKKQPGGEFVHWLPATAKPSDFLKAANVQPADPKDVATQLEVSDTEAVLQQLGLKGAKQLMAQLQHFIEQQER